MIFHLILNSLIVFLISTFSIEFFLFLFKIANARLRYLLRLLPLLKFPCDLLLFLFLGENLFVNFNPFSCQVYMQDLITDFGYLYLTTALASSENIIFPKYLANFIPPNLLDPVILSALVTSSIILSRKVYLFCQARSYLKKIFMSSSPSTRSIHNHSLLNKLKIENILVYTSPAIQIPFAANLHYIFIPQNLETALSQAEFESIIVHEFEHLRWKDPLLKMGCELLCALFWWLPSAWWLRRLELEQEDACDAEVYKYGIDVSALAMAMVKVVKNAKYQRQRFAAISAFDSPKNSHIRRIENILLMKNKRDGAWRYTFSVGSCLLTNFCFWIC